jgi:hypothetical protein
VTELPIDFIDLGIWPVGSCEARGLDGVGRSAQRVRAHVTDRNRLTGRAGGGCRCGSLDLSDRHAPDETAANLTGGVKLASRVRPSTSNRGPNALITGCLSLKQPKNSLSTVSGPRGDKAAVGFAQRLRRTHHRNSTHRLCYSHPTRLHARSPLSKSQHRNCRTDALLHAVEAHAAVIRAQITEPGRGLGL